MRTASPERRGGRWWCLGPCACGGEGCAGAPCGARAAWTLRSVHAASSFVSRCWNVPSRHTARLTGWAPGCSSSGITQYPGQAACGWQLRWVCIPRDTSVLALQSSSRCIRKGGPSVHVQPCQHCSAVCVGV